MIKVDKRVARKLFKTGKDIWVIPCKMRLNNSWQAPYRAKIGEVRDFDNFVNEYEFYNCTNNELGKYAAYYVEEGSLNE